MQATNQPAMLLFRFEPTLDPAIEFRPGSSVVHHIIVPGLGGIAPGNDPNIYRDGIASVLEAGQDLTWQMHYHKEPGPGTGAWDFSQAALRFYPEVPVVTSQSGVVGLARCSACTRCKALPTPDIYSSSWADTLHKWMTPTSGVGSASVRSCSNSDGTAGFN